MKTKSNYYLYSNFNNLSIDNSLNKNSLTINSIYNLTCDNNMIEPTNDFSDLLSSIVGIDNYTTLNNNNESLMNNIVYCTTYTFYDKSLKLNNERVFVLNSEYQLFELNFTNLKFNHLDIKFNNLPQFINIDGNLYILNHDDISILIHENNYPLIITTMPNIVSCVHFENYTLFCNAEDKFSVLVTQQTDMVNIETSLENYSQIELLPENGSILKLIIYKNNVYAIQQYGISKIVIKSDRFFVQSFCSIQSSIFSDTIALIDDYVVLYTTSGLYLFDGNDIKQIFKNICKNIDSKFSKHKAVAYNNKYFLKTKMYINLVSTAVIIQFDIENNNLNIHNIGNIIDIFLIQNMNQYKLCTSLKNQNETYSILFFNDKIVTSFEKYLKFNKLSFDEYPTKVLNEIKLQSNGKFKLYINSDIQNFCYDVNGSSFIKNIGIKGQYFEIEIKSESSFIIESILLKTTSYTED